MDRNAASCSACDWRNTIDCPVCQQAMEPQTHDGLRLDTCRSCKGVWFDAVELAAIWNLRLSETRQRRSHARGPSDRALAAGTGDILLIDALAYSPEVVIYGARAAGYAVASSADVLASAPAAAVGLVEGAGDAAASVFEAILDIISGLFS
jgi:Zn-finger nucleic acid-binding protein